MSTDKKIEEAIKPLVEMYSNIETELLKDIARHFSINDEFINADYWRIKKLEEMGAFNKHTLEYLSKQTGASQRKLRQCLKKIGIMTVDTPELSKLYKNGTIKVNPKVLLENYTIQTMINTAYNDLTNRFIQLSPQIEKASREAYLKVLEQTYLDVSMGTHSYDQAIRKAINDLSNEGLTTMTYQITDDAGNVVGTRNYDIEGIVRRDVLTGARQLSGEMNIELIKETGCKYVKFSEHLDCRITHFDWQGTIVPSDKWEDIAEYGDVAGIYGINCRHYVEPYFGEHRGKEEKEYTKQQCDDAYKLSQRQRYLERGLRSWKRKQEMYKANGDTEAYKKSKDKVNYWSKRLDNFSKDNKRRRDYTREQTINYNTSLPMEPSKNTDKVLVYKPEEQYKISKYEDITQEVLEKAKPNNDKIPEIFEYKEYNLSNSKFDTKDITEIDRITTQKVQNTIGGNFKLIHRVQNKNVRTPDAVYTNSTLFKGKQYFEIKSPKASQTLKSKSGKIQRQLNEAKGQSNNVVISLLRKECDLTNLEATNQLIHCLDRPSYDWIDHVILIGKDDYIKIYKKRRDRNERSF